MKVAHGQWALTHPILSNNALYTVYDMHWPNIPNEYLEFTFQIWRQYSTVSWLPASCSWVAVESSAPWLLRSSALSVRDLNNAGEGRPARLNLLPTCCSVYQVSLHVHSVSCELAVSGCSVSASSSSQFSSIHVAALDVQLWLVRVNTNGEWVNEWGREWVSDPSKQVCGVTCNTHTVPGTETIVFLLMPKSWADTFKHISPFLMSFTVPLHCLI